MSEKPRKKMIKSPAVLWWWNVKISLLFYLFKHAYAIVSCHGIFKNVKKQMGYLIYSSEHIFSRLLLYIFLSPH